jgi:SAM-dependent methyltransferase
VAGCPPGRAIDLGCGTGTNVRYLAEHGWQVSGIDYVPRAIARARRRLRGMPAQLLVGDVSRLEALPLRPPYDLALDVGCLHSLAPAARQRYAQGLANVLRPGARYLLFAFQPPASAAGPGIARADINALFERHFAATGYEPGQAGPAAAWYYFERRPARA